MKKNAFAVLVLAITLVSAKSQTYSIDWYKIAAGGGTSTNGQFYLSGTIGQHDACNPMTGGSFSLTGGFWSLLEVETPGAPLLSIRLTQTNSVMVFWPSPSAGYSLQQNTALNTTDWVAPAESVNDDGTLRFIIVTPIAGNRYYRLVRP